VVLLGLVWVLWGDPQAHPHSTVPACVHCNKCSALPFCCSHCWYWSHQIRHLLWRDSLQDPGVKSAYPWTPALPLYCSCASWAGFSPSSSCFHHLQSGVDKASPARLWGLEWDNLLMQSLWLLLLLWLMVASLKAHPDSYILSSPFGFWVSYPGSEGPRNIFFGCGVHYQTRPLVEWLKW
jgi:hypothetical protein